MMKNMTELFEAIIQFFLGMCALAAFITTVICVEKEPYASMVGVVVMFVFGALYIAFED